MKQYNNITTKKSFTIIEVIVAIFVITAGILGISALVTQTISSATLSSQKLVAAYLAQEGIEIVRNIRDTNWIEGVDWKADLFCASLPCDCEADYTTQALTDTYDGDYLNIDTNGFYSYSTGDQTKFKRKITISEPATDSCPAGDCLNVLVLIEWQEKGKLYSVSAQENLYDWLQ